MFRFVGEERALACVRCFRAPPKGRFWPRCTICVERNLPSTYYCGEECMLAHWPQHKVWHKEQKVHAEETRDGTVLAAERTLAKDAARHAEATGSEYDKRFAAAFALQAEGSDNDAAAKAWRKLIKMQPGSPASFQNLAVVLHRTNRHAEAGQMSLKAMELHEDGTELWARAAAMSFVMLKLDACREVPKPEWWNDEGLKALSLRVVAVASDGSGVAYMRARVLAGNAINEATWDAKPRTAAEIKEAATWFRRAARVGWCQAEKRCHEELARDCDEVADPLLAEEEAEASAARAAAEREAAETLATAEAKAKAAADELLAEEEKEKQQAASSSTKASKAKRGKGKKGKGNR